MQFLVIQTAFLGDVILATSVAEKLHQHFPDSTIDVLVREGNESVLENHPFIQRVRVFNKTKSKFKNLLALSVEVNRAKYDYVINLHRFGSSGFITWSSGAKEKIGFEENPFSFCYTKKITHAIGNGKHEIERNHELIASFTDSIVAKPKLYPTAEDLRRVNSITGDLPSSNLPYICIAPASVWFTKQFPPEKWTELVDVLAKTATIFLLGGKNDFSLCEEIKQQSEKKERVGNFAGKLSILQTAALMKGAKINYVNDSAPLHIASAMNAPVSAIFCSTVPSFGFGPLSDNSRIIETKEELDCRPCGLHGHKTCPEGHFNCAYSINIKDILS